MKRIVPFLLLLLFLSGCAGSVPAETEAAIPVIVREETLPPAPTEAVDVLELLLSCMSVEEKVGQLFLARCPGSSALEDALTYHLGGYLLFGRDFSGQTPDSIRAFLESLQSAVSIPLLIAVDEEGGTVCRVSAEPAFRESRFASPRSLYALGALDGVLSAEKEKAALLSSLGIRVCMGPVCDITTDPDAFMYLRSLGQSPEITGAFAAETVKILRKNGVGSVLKHFPGYGNNTDTHTGIAVDHRSLEELEAADLLPFRSGIEAGCDAVLMSHTIVTCFDDTLPVSLSPAAHDYLRSEMGFDGVILTDDLAMEAIGDTCSAGEAAVLAVLAGSDLLCSTEYAVQYAAVLEAVESGRISMEQLDSAVLRVLRWKQTLGLIF